MPQIDIYIFNADGDMMYNKSMTADSHGFLLCHIFCQTCRIQLTPVMMCIAGIDGVMLGIFFILYRGERHV